MLLLMLQVLITDLAQLEVLVIEKDGSRHSLLNKINNVGMDERRNYKYTAVGLTRMMKQEGVTLFLMGFSEGT